VGGSPCPARGDLVAFSDLIVNRHLDVWERDASAGESLLERLASDRLPVEDHSRSEDIIDDVQVRLIPGFFEEPPNDHLLLFDCHAPSSVDVQRPGSAAATGRRLHAAVRLSVHQLPLKPVAGSPSCVRDRHNLHTFVTLAEDDEKGESAKEVSARIGQVGRPTAWCVFDLPEREVELGHE
jgi:hypothetical protein